MTGVTGPPAMPTAALGPLTVSRLGLGAVQMGGRIPRPEAYRMLDRFLEAGGTLINTADTSLDGGSEETLASWLASHRDQVVVATAVRFPVSDPGGAGLSPERIRAEVALAWLLASEAIWVGVIDFQSRLPGGMGGVTGAGGPHG